MKSTLIEGSDRGVTPTMSGLPEGKVYTVEKHSSINEKK